ncbi:MAG: hypothetical protein K2Q24_10505 [Chitinophagaceae bacterium]|nr:hypothetical protein [Chitinophagaceae bacterium]
MKNDCVKDIPACIENKINQLKAKPKGTASSEVNEYNYKGKRVFHFAAYCCDVYGELLDENCNYICAPDGGITGGGNGACTDFFSTATNKRLVWKDER